MGSSSDDSPDLHLPVVGSCTNLYFSIDPLVGRVVNWRLRLNKILAAKILSLLRSYSSLRFLSICSLWASRYCLEYSTGLYLARGGSTGRTGGSAGATIGSSFTSAGCTIGKLLTSGIRGTFSSTGAGSLISSKPTLRYEPSATVVVWRMRSAISFSDDIGNSLR